MTFPQHQIGIRPGPARRRWVAGGLALLLPLFAGRAAAAVRLSDEISYGSVTLRPGDVINLNDGIFVGVTGWGFGHTGMYLGRDKPTGDPLFLDFTTVENPGQSFLQGYDRKFKGRILHEVNFLKKNQDEHPSFTVFRLQGAVIDKEKLQERAAYLSETGVWGVSDFCTTAVMRTLDAATGTPVIAARTGAGLVTPDGLVSANPPSFRRLHEKPIDIHDARHEAIERQGVTGRLWIHQRDDSAAEKHEARERALDGIDRAREEFAAVEKQSAEEVARWIKRFDSEVRAHLINPSPRGGSFSPDRDLPGRNDRPPSGSGALDRINKDFGNTR